MSKVSNQISGETYMTKNTVSTVRSEGREIPQVIERKGLPVGNFMTG